MVWINIIHAMAGDGYLPRLLEGELRRALGRFPVVVLSGARQTGKTTLAGRFPDRLFRSLDDLDVQETAQKRPESLLVRGTPCTFDEVQRAPGLLSAIKRDVDRDRKPGRFLLTGSANLLLLRRVSESLAGRAVYLHLWPMTESEKAGSPAAGPWDDLLGAKDPASALRLLGPGPELRDWPQRAFVGGFPVQACSTDPVARRSWFDGYVRTYLERDLQEVSSISTLPDFRRLMRLAAARLGQVLNQSALARDASLPQPTCHRWLNLLETSFQIVRVPAYAGSRTSRLVRAPKLYWSDPGLGAHLAGLGSPEALEADPLSGAFLENLVLLGLLAWRETASPRPEIHYWRTRQGREVDFVIESGRRLLPIEVKAAREVGVSDAVAVEAFLEERPRSSAPFGVVLYSGGEARPMTARVLAVPLSTALGLTGGRA